MAAPEWTRWLGQGSWPARVERGVELGHARQVAVLQPAAPEEARAERQILAGVGVDVARDRVDARDEARQRRRHPAGLGAAVGVGGEDHAARPRRPSRRRREQVGGARPWRGGARRRHGPGRAAGGIRRRGAERARPRRRRGRSPAVRRGSCWPGPGRRSCPRASAPRVVALHRQGGEAGADPLRLVMGRDAPPRRAERSSSNPRRVPPATGRDRLRFASATVARPGRAAFNNVQTSRVERRAGMATSGPAPQPIDTRSCSPTLPGLWPVASALA